MSLIDEIRKRLTIKKEDKESDNQQHHDKSEQVQQTQQYDDTAHQQPLSEQPCPNNVDNATCPKTVEKQIESKEELVKQMVDITATLFDNEETDSGKRVVIWLDTDELTFNTYNTEQYKQRLLASALNECGVKFASVAFSLGIPDKELRCTPFGKSGKLFMQAIEDKAEKPIAPQRASISVFGNAGSLVKESYILSACEMKKEKILFYNIGSGEFPQVPTGYRHNHIAIDDNPASPMVEKNKYVSRMHAHIGFSDQVGFYLQVERDGTRLMGKRTRIFRGKEIIEMDNLLVKVPLHDGDLIELGKAVVLLYRQIDDE